MNAQISVPNVNVIVDLGWDEYPLQTGHIVPDDYIA
jgi:hypothetical protein